MKTWTTPAVEKLNVQLTENLPVRDGKGDIFVNSEEQIIEYLADNYQ